MTCARCGTEIAVSPKGRPDNDPWTFGRSRWCARCDGDFDGWSRRHATDIVWEALGGMLVVMGFGVGLPLLGASVLVSAGGVFVGFGTIVALHRYNARRRRRQFLSVGDVPRAYLPGKT